MNADGRFDHMVANFERYGRYTAPCLDCEVGEPHVCPKRFKKDMAQQRRALQILRDLEALQ